MRDLHVAAAEKVSRAEQSPASTHRPWYRILYVQVILAIVAGVVMGHFFPLIGNGVATIVISSFEGELDVGSLHATMAHPLDVSEALARSAAE